MNNQLKILVVDDEQPALDRMKRIINHVLPDAESQLHLSSEKALRAVEDGFHADVALLDIRLPGMDGLELAKRLKMRLPRLNIIFSTAYTDFVMKAFEELRASGYLLKPITEDGLQRELDNLRYEVPKRTSSGKPYIQTFGNFDVFMDGKPIKFKRKKSKEVLAYLVDRKGGQCDNKSIAAVVIEEDGEPVKQSNYISLCIRDMIADLKEAGIDGIVQKKYGSICLLPDRVECDYYKALGGDVSSIRQFTGEYMAQYSWGEWTLKQDWKFQAI